jgi:hypothetical protein
MIEPIKRLPYHLWASVTKRPAAPPVATRQSKRNLLLVAA